MDLVEFLNARFDEDKQVARAAAEQRGGGQWAALPDPEGMVAVTGGPDPVSGVLPVVVHPDEDETSAHIARHDPARALVEVDAKRRIVDASAASCSVACTTNQEHSFSGSCALRALGPVREVHGQRWVRDETGSYVPAPPVTPEWTLRLLALPYADHSDYDEAWRP